MYIHSNWSMARCHRSYSIKFSWNKWWHAMVVDGAHVYRTVDARMAFPYWFIRTKIDRNFRMNISTLMHWIESVCVWCMGKWKMNQFALQIGALNFAALCLGAGCTCCQPVVWHFQPRTRLHYWSTSSCRNFNSHLHHHTHIIQRVRILFIFVPVPALNKKNEKRKMENWLKIVWETMTVNDNFMKKKRKAVCIRAANFSRGLTLLCFE